MNIAYISILLLQTFTVFAQISYDYGEVLRNSILFYEAQRSGRLPANNRIPWRGDTFLDDGITVGVDLEGGYFDAGDFVKFGFPLASTITTIGWGLLEYKSGYQAAGEFENGLAAFKWGLDYMIKAHAAPSRIWFDVGNANEDHASWGRPEDWNSITSPRLCLQINETHPGSDMAGEFAASFAVAYLVYSDINPTLAQEYLQHAKDAYDFAYNFRGRYSVSVPSTGYGSSRYEDELLWASAWLYRSTMNATYLANAKSLWDEGLDYTPSGGYQYDDKLAGAQVLLAKIAGETEPAYTNATARFCDYMRSSAPRTPLGLVWIAEWGSLRLASSASFVCLLAADIGINTVENRALAKQQINYALGDTGRSFVCGVGVNPPVRPHHRAASCPIKPEPCDWNAFNNEGPNPQVLYGALVGGPGLNGSYEDLREDYVKNEVAIDYNSGFQGALAGLLALENPPSNRSDSLRSSVNKNYMIFVMLCFFAALFRFY